jgi:hypothetical protein
MPTTNSTKQAACRVDADKLADVIEVRVEAVRLMNDKWAWAPRGRLWPRSSPRHTFPITNTEGTVCPDCPARIFASSHTTAALEVGSREK